MASLILYIFLITAVGDSSRFPYRGWQNQNNESYDEGKIAPFRPILSRPTKPPLIYNEEQETLSMTSRDKARIFQMRRDILVTSRLNSKFRFSEGTKLFPVRRKNEETHSVNSANLGNLMQTEKSTSFQQDSEKKTMFERTNDSKFPDNILSVETINSKRSQENKSNIISSSENNTASPSTNDDIWRKESESKSTNNYVELRSKSKEDDSISFRGRESVITKSQDFTNHTDSLPSTNSNDAKSNHNQLQNRVSLFKKSSQNSSNIIYPNTDDVSSATIFLPTAPTFPINMTEPEFPINFNSTEESTIIQAIFQQVDGLDQNTEVK